VLEGADWGRWRPRVVVIEATVPMSATPNHEQWEHLLLDAGYLFATFDGLNRFYVRPEDQGLAQLLRTPVNVFDDYRPFAHAAQVAGLEATLIRTRSELNATRRELQKFRSLGPIPLRLALALGRLSRDYRRITVSLNRSSGASCCR
jgi:hypothetical protein